MFLKQDLELLRCPHCGALFADAPGALVYCGKTGNCVMPCEPVFGVGMTPAAAAQRGAAALNQDRQKLVVALSALQGEAARAVVQALFGLTQRAAPGHAPSGLSPKDSYVAGYFDGVRASIRAADLRAAELDADTPPPVAQD